jgi:hypothetical protein
MPRKKIVRPATTEEQGAAFAKRVIRNVAFGQSSALVEVEWHMDGVIMLEDGNHVKFINKRAKIQAKYLSSLKKHGCRLVSRETTT